MVDHFLVALNAGVEFAAAFEFNGNNIALRVVVYTLGALVHVGSVANDWRSSFRFHDSNRSTCSTPFTLLRR